MRETCARVVARAPSMGKVLNRLRNPCRLALRRGLRPSCWSIVSGSIFRHIAVAKYKTRPKRVRQHMVFRRWFLLQEVRTSNTRPDSWSDNKGKGRLFPNKTVQLLLSGRSVVPRSAPRRSALLRLVRVSAALLRLAPLRSVSLRLAPLRSVSLRSAI